MNAIPRVGFGYDIHPLVADRALLLGGIRIESAVGLAGHSDGDAVLHAVADALLAAVGEPDLGQRFPATDERYRNANSAELLAAIVTDLDAGGIRFGNCSIVLNAEVPRLAPYIDTMRARVAELLAPLADPRDSVALHRRVAITPKRGEGLGEVGAGNAIAVWATVLVFEHVDDVQSGTVPS